MRSSELEAITYPFSTKFQRITHLQTIASPAIATYTLLPAVLPSLSYFVGLFVIVLSLSSCRAAVF